MKQILKKLLLGRSRLMSERLPQVELSTLLAPAHFDVKLLSPRVAYGNVSLFELFAINALIKQCAPKTLFEFGTFNGRTTLNLAANSGAEARVYTLDMPQSQLQSAQYNVEQIEKAYIEKAVSGELFQNHPEANKITQLFGDSATFDYGPYLGQVDFVFVDASHAYDYVKNDSQIAIKLLRHGKGMILWHDYDRPQWWPGVIRALNELKQNVPGFETLTHIEGTTIACLIKH